MDVFEFFIAGDHTKTVAVLAAGAVLGALMKFIFDEWSAKNHARRDMIGSVTKSVEELAKQYYWHLANNASTLAEVFKDYLNHREEIQLSQHPPRDLRRELDQLIDKKVSESFYYYARLTKLTYEFDWRAGSTFFLRDFWAGQTIRNLQNSLKEVLDLDSELIDHVDTPGPDGKTIESTPLNLQKNTNLDGVRKKYRNFFEDEEKVRRARKYLATCSELFYYELAQLYRDWFRFRRGRVPWKPPLGSGPLRKSVTVNTLETIRDVAESSRTRGYVIAPLSSPSDLRQAVPLAPARFDASGAVQATPDPAAAGQPESGVEVAAPPPKRALEGKESGGAPTDSQAMATATISSWE